MEKEGFRTGEVSGVSVLVSGQREVSGVGFQVSELWEVSGFRVQVSGQIKA